MQPFKQRIVKLRSMKGKSAEKIVLFFNLSGMRPVKIKTSTQKYLDVVRRHNKFKKLTLIFRNLNERQKNIQV